MSRGVVAVVVAFIIECEREGEKTISKSNQLNCIQIYKSIAVVVVIDIVIGFCKNELSANYPRMTYNTWTKKFLV